MEALFALGTGYGCGCNCLPAFHAVGFFWILLAVGWTFTPGVLGWIWVMDGTQPFRLGIVFADVRAC